MSDDLSMSKGTGSQAPPLMRGFLIDEDDNSPVESTYSGPTSPAHGAPTQMRGFLIDEDDGFQDVEGVGGEPFTAQITPPTVDAFPDRAAMVDMASSQGSPQGRSESGKNLLRLVAVLLPGDERSEWLEEQRRYLTDLPSRRARWAWVVAQLVAMPRYAYAVRTGNETEPA
ncbi:hypothetical protein [Streptomyces niveus]|uniref:Uncharacterized protein n=1 Tax=Streptomyces niveus TaxID=193462 RepID=A0A1U9QTZ1_STRNV|nr:hypothetical protein [Streptomyces niveus]AQU67728.1 hypothetical protein BBN63_17260 [Streptomyces niveus]